MQLSDFTNEKIFDLNETIAAELFTQTTYAWEVLPMISDFIRRIGPTLPADRFEQRGEDIWLQRARLFLTVPISADPASSTTAPRSGTAPLSAEAPSWEKERQSAIPLSSRT